jgi:adenosylcobinamide kinase/adenosylcobinamide-phosphate guanylyltransferase
VDCITLWISNLLLETDKENSILQILQRLMETLETCPCPVILVSNEVGTGIVPENRLARRFRDIAGIANQKLAACSNRVVWVVAGIPVRIKGAERNAIP